MKKEKKIPHTFIILFALVFLSSCLTYIIPSGEFERAFDDTTGETLVVADSYKQIEQNPVAPYKILHKFFEALTITKNATLIFFIILVGGAFEIILRTDCITALVESILSHMRGKELWVIPIFVSAFSVFGFTMGLTTASIVFVPVGITVAKTMRLPKICGMAMIALGTNVGFTAGIFNPFGVGIAQTIAEVPLYSGAGYRFITLLILIMVTSLYLVWYASKHREPVRVYENKDVRLKIRQKIVLGEFVIAFVILTVGISKYGWSVKDIVVILLLVGIVIGLSKGFTPGQICEFITEGCRKMIKGALVIGIAATIRLILSEGNILDTITYYLTGLVYYMPSEIQLLGIFLFNASINFLITSGSAKAALVMPIFTPMTDILGLTRQSAVYAFQMGDGLTNLASPISTTLNGILAVSDETYASWIKFYIPLVGIYIVIGSIMVMMTKLLGY